jgi:hypothetical protein
MTKYAMARGVIVVDENLEHIIPALKDLNIRVFTPPKGMDDETIKTVLLPHRIFVTNNLKDFKKDTIPYEYSIISTENISFKDPKKLAKTISDALIEYELWSKRSYGFILHLHDSGKNRLEEIKG